MLAVVRVSLFADSRNCVIWSARAPPIMLQELVLEGYDGALRLPATLTALTRQALVISCGAPLISSPP